MDLYTASLILGGGGLAVMGIAGMTHTHADSGAHTLSGHSVGHGHHIGHGHGGHAPSHGHHAAGAHSFRTTLGRGLLAVVSDPTAYSHSRRLLNPRNQRRPH